MNNEETGAEVDKNGDSEAIVEDIMTLAKEGNFEELRRRIRDLVSENLSLKAKKNGDDESDDDNDDESTVMFQVDVSPAQISAAEDDGERSRIIYEAKDNVLTNEDVENDTLDLSLLPRSSNCCWNCEGDHMITSCPEPRDFKRIAQNRRQFMKNQPLTSSRYHLDNPQRFAHLTPGLPSRKLREALGIRSNQIPSYIYRMRTLGYPPGWLKEAEIDHSGVALYVSENKSLVDPDSEEGEIRVQYDTSKLIKWPGFNVDPGPEMKDETKYFNVPPLQDCHRHSTMIEEMKPNEQKAYVRGTMQDTSSITTATIVRKDTTSDSSTPKISASVKSREEGTPIIQGYSPFNSLPSQEKWAKDTTDHILFENLPDSTGKWEQMLDVIKKGREVQSKIKEIAKEETESNNSSLLVKD